MNKENFKSVVISVFFSELTALLFLVIFAFLTYKQEDPTVYYKFSGISGLFIGALSCSLISTLITKRKSTSIPLISCGIYCLLQIFCTIIWSDNDFNGLSMLIKLLICMAICWLITHFLKDKKRKTKHKRILNR